MEMSQDFVMSIVGAQQCEIVALRMEVAQLKAKLQPTAPPADNVLPIKEAG